MWVEELSVKGYGKLKDFRIEPGSGLNVIFGPNESGKSTVGNCLRDLLLGPGQWEGEEHGARAPQAKPQDGTRFEARARYCTDDGKQYTVQRDFGEDSCRLRDNQAGSEVPLGESGGLLPGVRLPDLEGKAPTSTISFAPGEDPAARSKKLMAARGRVSELQQEVKRWSYRYHKAQLTRLSSVAERVEQLEKQLADMSPQLTELRGGKPHPSRGAAASAGKHLKQRLEALQGETAELGRRLEELQERRKELGNRLAPYERYYSITTADLEMMRALEMADMGDVEEKKRHMEDFRTQEADIARRLEHLGSFLGEFKSEDEFEDRVGALESASSRGDLLSNRLRELEENQAQQHAHRQSGQMLTISAIILTVLTPLLAAFPFVVKTMDVRLAAIAVLTVVGASICWSLKTRHEREVEAVTSAAAPLQADIERLRAVVNPAREALQSMLKQANCTTLKELRSHYREFRSLQRDQSNVRDYIVGLESTIGAREAPLEKPRLLIECGLLTESEPLTHKIITDFLLRYESFTSLRQEEETAKTRMQELKLNLDQRREEEETLRSSLGESGGEHEADEHEPTSEEYARLRSQHDTLQQRVDNLCQGVDPKQMRAQLDESKAEVARHEKAEPTWVNMKAEVSALGEYHTNLEKAQAKFEKAQQELTELQGPMPTEQPVGDRSMPSGLAAVAQSIETAFTEITQQSISVRLRKEKRKLVMTVQRDSGGWVAPGALGRSASELLEALLQAAYCGDTLGGNLPVVLDDPFARLDEARQHRAFEWLLQLSRSRQVFLLASESTARDAIRTMLSDQQVAFREAKEGTLEILASTHEQAGGRL